MRALIPELVPQSADRLYPYGSRRAYSTGYARPVVQQTRRWHSTPYRDMHIFARSVLVWMPSFGEIVHSRSIRRNNEEQWRGWGRIRRFDQTGIAPTRWEQLRGVSAIRFWATQPTGDSTAAGTLRLMFSERPWCRTKSLMLNPWILARRNVQQKHLALPPS